MKTFQILLSLVFSLIAFSLGTLPMSSSALAVSQCDPEKLGCRYYLCRELESPCGAEGYYIGFGYKYCDEFSYRVRKDLSRRGQIWLDQTQKCLTRELGKASPALSCGKIHSVAFESHKPCYIDTGFCRLSPSDKLRVFYAVREELLWPERLSDFIELSLICAERGY